MQLIARGTGQEYNQRKNRKGSKLPWSDPNFRRKEQTDATSESIYSLFGSRLSHATYAIASGTVLTAVMLLWQPSHTTLFEAQGLLRLPFHAAFLLAIAGFVWGVRALGAFDPFGQSSICGESGGIRVGPNELIDFQSN